MGLVVPQFTGMTVTGSKSPIKRQHLAAMGRSRQAATLAITGGADGIDHGMNVRAGAACGLQALKHDDGTTLADDDPIAVGAKRPGLPLTRQGTGLGKAEVREGPLQVVDAADNHPIALSSPQLGDRHINRCQGGSTGGINQKIGSRQVECIADPTGRDVAEQTWEA